MSSNLPWVSATLLSLMEFVLSLCRVFIDLTTSSMVWLVSFACSNQIISDGTTSLWGLMGRTRTGSFVVLLIEMQWKRRSVPRDDFPGD